jgi:hypothetical protein
MRELSWKPEQSAELQLLGEGAPSPGWQAVRILELSGKRVRLAAGVPVKSSDAVRLEWDGQLLLGQVLVAEPDGFWMEVHHMLVDNGGLNWRQNGWQRE